MICSTGEQQIQAHEVKYRAKDGPITPLMAETGGTKALRVDSRALPRRVVGAVAQSAFRSVDSIANLTFAPGHCSW